MLNNDKQGLAEQDFSQQPSKTLSVSDRTGTDPYANKPFESKIWAPDYKVLPGAMEQGNIPSPSGSGFDSQNDLKNLGSDLAKKGL